MRHRSRLVIAVGAALAAALALPAASTPNTTTVSITVSNLRNVDDVMRDVATALDSIDNETTRAAVGTAIGLVLVLRFRDAAPKLALIVALPAALNVLMAMRPELDLRALLMLKELLLIAIAPAAIAVLLARLFGPGAQPSGGALSG